VKNTAWVSRRSRLKDFQVGVVHQHRVPCNANRHRNLAVSG
jgi:hypothetical protein